ncbi:hypothetical protein HaLaN_32126, partial [Haematococcus lacustris]
MDDPVDMLSKYMQASQLSMQLCPAWPTTCYQQGMRCDFPVGWGSGVGMQAWGVSLGQAGSQLKAV